MTHSLKTSDNILAAVDAYTAAGYVLTPLKGKIPLSRQWQKTEYNPFPVYESLKNNFGVVLQATDLVIDIDPRNYKGDENSFTRLCADLKLDLENLAGFVVRTGSGGMHLYFTKPAQFKIRNALPEYPGVEFKSKGQQVVGMGCVHPDTKKIYELIKGSPQTITDAPQALIERILKQDYSIPNKTSGEFTDDDLSKQRYKEYLLNAPISIEGDGGDKTLFSVACKAHEYGLHPATAFEMLHMFYNDRCDPPWDMEDLKKKVHNAYKYAQNDIGAAHPKADFTPILMKHDEIAWHFKADGVGLRLDLHNTVCHLMDDKGRLGGLFGFNEFTRTIEFLKIPPWGKAGYKYDEFGEHDLIELKTWLSRFQDFEPKTQILQEAVIKVARNNGFNPVKDWLNGLVWDGTPRLETFLINHAGANDNIYTRAVSKKFMVALVARILSPGVKFDTMLILEGSQGIKKSTLFETLAGDHWFTSMSLDAHSKDNVELTRGKLLVEIADMSISRRTEVEALKAFLSRRIDRVRLPYARKAEDYPRQYIFVGTINPEADDDVGYLRDTTGNRRFWPVPVESIDIDSIAKIRVQLFAEAVRAFKGGFPLYFDDHKIEIIARQIQEERMGMDAWTEKLRWWLNQDLIRQRDVITGYEIFTECLLGVGTRYSRVDQIRISKIMKNLGWEKGAFYDTRLNDTIRGYRRQTITHAYLAANEDMLKI